MTDWVEEMIIRFKESSKNVNKKSLYLSREEKIGLVKEIDFKAFKELFMLVVNGYLNIDISLKKIDIRNTGEYSNWHRDVLKRDNYTCQECGDKEKLEVHHIKSLKFYPELAVDTDNGLTLCNICHKKTDSYGYKVITNHIISLRL